MEINFGGVQPKWLLRRKSKVGYYWQNMNRVWIIIHHNYDVDFRKITVQTLKFRETLNSKLSILTRVCG